jgi:hypothetical protein
MAYDLAIDMTSGDLIFGPSRDLLGVTGPELDKQRILTRCKIRRGSFQYDDSKTLGSRLHEIQRFDINRQVREAPALVQEALEPMTDITIQSIDVEATEDNRLSIQVNYKPVTGTGDDENPLPETVVPEYDARVTV